MRPAVLAALEQLRASNQLLQEWREHHASAAGVLPHAHALPPRDHPWWAQGDTRLAHVEDAYRQLQACLAHALASTHVELVWSHILEVYIGSAAASHGLVVIELSSFGPLAATYVYHTVPAHVVKHVSDCLKARGLIELLPEEIDELEARQLYNELM